MKVATVTGVTELGETRIQKQIHGIAIDITSAADSSSDLSEKISVRKQGRQSQIDSVINIPIGDLAQIHAALKGTPYRFETGNSKRSEIFFQICGSGAWKLDTDEYYKLTMENLVAKNTYKIFGIENPMGVPLFESYKQQSIAQGIETQEIGLKGKECVAFSKANLKLIEVRFPGGAACEYLPEELDFLTMDNQAVTIANSTQVPVLSGAGSLYVLGVVDAINIQITKVDKDQDLTVYTVESLPG